MTARSRPLAFRLGLLVLALLIPLLASCDTELGSDWDEELLDWLATALTMRIVVLDIGQGDAILVISPGGDTMLVDGGNSRSDAQEVILPYLSQQGIESLDVVVLTHPDADHVGGLPEVLRSLPVKHIVSTGQIHTSQIYTEFLQELKTKRDKQGTEVIRGVAGAEIPFDPSIKVSVLGPSPQSIEGEDTNNASIVLRIAYGQIAALLTGDAEGPQEEWMMAQDAGLTAQILKVSHHGSKFGSGTKLLDVSEPEVALISCGADNPYGHPHRAVLERLRRREVEVYRTDRSGTITVISDGSHYWVETAR